MRKRLLAGLAIAALIGATMVSTADARGGGGGMGGGGWHGGGGGMGGGWHGGGGGMGGGWHGGGGGGAWHGGGNGDWNHGHGGWGGWHNSGFHGHNHGSHFFGTSLFIGVPFAYWWGYPYWYWDPWYYGGYYYGPYYGSSYGPSAVYDDSTAVAPSTAPVGEVRWYCPDSGYYPTVRSCERGWMRVLPGGTPPASSQ